MTHALARVLVTGAQGFIGRWTLGRLLTDSTVDRVVGIGRSARDDERFTHNVTHQGARVRARLPQRLCATLADPRYAYHAVDVRDDTRLSAVITELRPTAVIHLASRLRDDDLDAMYAVNVLGTARLLEAIAASDVHRPRIVIGSTGGVYGRVSDDRLPIAECTPPRPADTYTASKAAAEALAGVIASRLELPLVIARIFNPVGVGLDERHLCAALALQFAELTCTSSTIRVGPLDSTRDLVHIEDVVDALVALVERGEPGHAYNVGSGEEVAMQCVFDRLVSRSCRNDVTIQRRCRRPCDISRHVADITAIRALWVGPRRTWQSALDDIYLDYVERVGASRSPRQPTSP